MSARDKIVLFDNGTGARFFSRETGRTVHCLDCVNFTRPGKLPEDPSPWASGHCAKIATRTAGRDHVASSSCCELFEERSKEPVPA
jgi:hypothetical protein